MGRARTPWPARGWCQPAPLSGRGGKHQVPTQGFLRESLTRATCTHESQGPAELVLSQGDSGENQVVPAQPHKKWFGTALHRSHASPHSRWCQPDPATRKSCDGTLDTAPLPPPPPCGQVSPSLWATWLCSQRSHCPHPGLSRALWEQDSLRALTVAGGRAWQDSSVVVVVGQAPR